MKPLTNSLRKKKEDIELFYLGTSLSDYILKLKKNLKKIKIKNLLKILKTIFFLTFRLHIYYRLPLTE